MKQIILLTKEKDFPLDTDVLRSMQDTYQFIEKSLTAVLGINNAILSGVEMQDDGKYSAGIVCIAGEIMPFQESAGENLKIIVVVEQTTTATGEKYDIQKAQYAQATTVTTMYPVNTFVRYTLADVYLKMTDTREYIKQLEEQFDQYVKKTTEPVQIRYVEVKNKYTEIKQKEMIAYCNDLRIASLRGALHFADTGNPLVVINPSGEKWFKLFGLGEALIFNSGLQPVAPEGAAIYFEGIRPTTRETFTFRLKSNGDFEVWVHRDSLFNKNTDTHISDGIFINMIYHNPIPEQ